MTMGIYGFYYQNKCIYIGQSSAIENRYHQHISRLKRGRHSCAPFQKWFDDNNIKVNDLKHIILEEVKDEIFLHKKEKEYFDKETPLCFGMIPSGESEWYTGIVFSDEVRRKLSESSSSRTKDAPYGRDSSGRILNKRTCYFCGKLIFIADCRIKFCSLACGAFSQHGKNSLIDVSRETLEELIKEPITLEEMAKVLGTSRPTVQKYLKKHGLDKLRVKPEKTVLTFPGLTKEVIEKAVETSSSRIEIARKLNVTRKQTYILEKRFNVKLIFDK